MSSRRTDTIPARKARAISRLVQMNPSKGLNNLVSPSLIDNREFSDSQNVQYDEGGVVRKRDGYTQVLDSLTAAKGLGMFVTESVRQVCTVDAGTFKYATSSSWTAPGGASFSTGNTLVATNLVTNPSIEVDTTGWAATTTTAVSATNLTTSGNNADATSYNSASITPTANTLILAWVYSTAAAAPNTPTASGNGLTWVEVGNQIDSDNLRKVTLFRAMGSSPSTGAVTFSFGGQTQTGCTWSIAQFSNVDTSGTNGSGAIVQFDAEASVGSVSSLTSTLAAFADANNATAGGFGYPLNNGNGTAGSGFTQVGEQFQGSPNMAIFSEFNAAADTTVDISIGASSVPIVAISVEIKRSPTTIARDTSQAYVGSASLKLTTASSGTQYAAYTVSGLTIGQTYTVQGRVLASSSTVATSIRTSLDSYATLGTYSSNNLSWTLHTLTITAGATSGTIEFGVGNSDFIYIDAVMANLSTESSDYFDGATTDMDGYIYAWSGSANASTSTKNLSAGNEITFTQARNKLYVWNGVDGGTEWDGSTLSRPGTMPKAKFGIYYSSYHIVSGVAGQPNRVYISVLADASDFTNAATTLNNATEVPGATVFAGTGANFIDVRPNDGDKITGLGRFQDSLIVFKEKSIYQLTFDDSGDPIIASVTAATGCVSHKSIETVENDLYFLSREGVRVLGNEPNFFTAIRTSVISIRIQPTIDSIDQQYYSKASAHYFDNKYILSVPVGGSSINRTLAYDRRFQAWSLWTNFNGNSYIQYIDSNNEAYLYFLDDNGAQVNVVTPGTFSDDGEAIEAFVVSKAFDMGNPDILKFFADVGLVFRRLSGEVTASIYTDDGVTFGSAVLGVGGSNGMGLLPFGTQAFGTGTGDTTETQVFSEEPQRIIVNTNSRTIKFKIYNNRPLENFVLLGYIIAFYSYGHFNFDSSNKIYI